MARNIIERTVTPLTLEQAKALTHGDRVYHLVLRNSDGTALRVRVTGMPKTWKRNPARVQVPVKYGLRQSFYLRSGMDWRDNLNEWSLDDPTQAQEAPSVTL